MLTSRSKGLPVAYNYVDKAQLNYPLIHTSACATYLWASIPNCVLTEAHDGHTCTRSRGSLIGNLLKMSGDAIIATHLPR